ncbi:MAG: hypothetical protein L0154_11385 [Chloroflexi bacterium]|nr:hypothetical protein [Chloroflexota bacterium]
MDQAFIAALLQSLDSGSDKYNLSDDAKVAIKRIRKAYKHVKHKVVSVPLIDEEATTGKRRWPNVSYLVESIVPWMRQLSAALVYDALQERDEAVDWDTVSVWSAEFIASPNPQSLPFEKVAEIVLLNYVRKFQLESLDWVSGWSAHPRPYPEAVYHFQLHFEPDGWVFFSHVIYRQFQWYVSFLPSSEALIGLRERVGQF